VQAASYVGSLPPLQTAEPVNQASLAALLLKTAARKRRAGAGAILQAAVSLQAQCLASRECVLAGGGGGGRAGSSATGQLPPLLRGLSDAMLNATEAAQTAAGQLLLKPSGGQVGGDDKKASAMYTKINRMFDYCDTHRSFGHASDGKLQRRRCYMMAACCTRRIARVPWAAARHVAFVRIAVYTMHFICCD
jgi:hypothetical protein